MAIVTTYVCDVTGKNGTERNDFVDVTISASRYTPSAYHNGSYKTDAVNVKKLVHKDVAAKLNLLPTPTGEEAQPEVSFEGKLKTLLKDYVADLVQDHLDNQ